MQDNKVHTESTDTSTELAPSVDCDTKKESKKNLKREKINLSPLLILVCLVVVLVGLAYFIPVVATNIIASRASDIYKTKKDEYSTKIEDQINRIIDNYIEEKYHFGNQVKIEIGNINELSNLEILNISYTSYVKEDGKDNTLNMTVWEAITGKGAFVMDLSLAEIKTDISRKAVVVKAPKPVLVSYGINEEDIEILFIKNDLDFNLLDNHGQVEAEIYKKLEDTAKEEIQFNFLTTAEYYDNATISASSTIEKLIKSLNPDIENLSVEVEFY